MAIKTYGTMAVDWEERIDFDRLRRERLERIKGLLKQSEMGALLCFDMNNVRYITATHIGTWAQDKANRFTLLPQDDEPILWDFGSAAKHHQLYSPWLGEKRSRAGISMLRGAMSPEMGRAEDVANKIWAELKERGLEKEPVGVDITELPVLFELQKKGLNIIDGQQLMSEARLIKTVDEIALLTHAAAQVDAAYDELYRAMKPGMRENEAVGLVSKVLYDLGSEYVEAVNAISGERCNPHPHVFSDRMLRPGDPVYYDILQSYMGYRTCYYRTFTIGYSSHAMVDAYKRCRDYLDAAIELVRPGRTTGEIASVWPKATDFGFPNEEAAFALQYGHGIGLAIWEKPVISRLVSLDHPHEIKPGMVFALETYWPSSDGWSAARIEEEIVVTETGHEVITRFPANDLMVAGRHYYTATGPLSTTRTHEPELNEQVFEMVKAVRG
ncbi:MAG: aminopeptidase P family protein [Anaerolineaceae bacterium]|nr:MAG: aminopeptidase P family protein [Anaerolineaceae bacterium]